MIIASINKAAFGDSIWLNFSKEPCSNYKINRVNDIVLIQNDQNELIGLNLFNWSQKLGITKDQGFIQIDSNQVDVIAGSIPEFRDFLVQELGRPYFVVGEVKKIEDHPKLQKLKLIQVEIGQEKLIQLVSGSINLKVGLKTVVAQVGAIMPNGKIVTSAKIGGLDSPGALCNRADLKLSSPEIKGAIEITDSGILPGTDFAEIEKIDY
ncbi:YtpR family tRNA-binding protein [Xylocopilactobacillus apicola]|uniref:tRNA-binding protein n=1 Tax=Xylocopilactobacillus apicola TaxID=2932184 RepID=A0AAU9D4U1_9LACO|nr:DUF4479 domain-containing protein [Xylocopilactobacillus apicola]BDR58513.1 tRNA-binding protein [Xylocopilactobacillus apicola]